MFWQIIFIVAITVNQLFLQLLIFMNDKLYSVSSLYLEVEVHLKLLITLK